MSSPRCGRPAPQPPPDRRAGPHRRWCRRCSSCSGWPSVSRSAHEGLLVRQGRGLRLPVRRRLAAVGGLRRRCRDRAAEGRDPDGAAGAARGRDRVLRVPAGGVRAGAAFKGSAIVTSITPDALPESYRVKLKDPRKYGVVQDAIAQRPGVDRSRTRRASSSRSSTCSRYPDRLAGHRDHHGRRGDPADRQHHPGVGVHPPARDRHHAAGRRVQPLDPAAVRARGGGRRADRRRCSPPGWFALVAKIFVRTSCPATFGSPTASAGHALGVVGFTLVLGVALAAVASFLSLQRYLRV